MADLKDKLVDLEALKAVYDAQKDELDTAKDVLNGRIDLIVSAPTTDNTELVDIREGADGTTYQAAGTAVRSQVDGLSKMVQVKDTQPTESWNRVWFNTNPTEIEIPTIEDVDKVQGDLGYATVDPTSGELFNKVIREQIYVGSPASNYQSRDFAVKDYWKTISVAANTSNNTYVTFLTESIEGLNGGDSIAGILAGNETGRHLVTKNTTETFTIPDGCKYINIMVKSYSGASSNNDYTPSLIRVYDDSNSVYGELHKQIESAAETDDTLSTPGVAADAKAVGDEINNISGTLQAEIDKISGDIKASILNVTTEGTLISGKTVGSGAVVNYNAAGNASREIQVQSGWKTITVKSSDSQNAYITFLQSSIASVDVGNPVDLAPGETDRHQIPSGGSIEAFDIPAGCNIINIMTKSGTSSSHKTYTPAAVIVSGSNGMQAVLQEQIDDLKEFATTNTSLSESGVAADAKATGDAARNIAVLSKWLLEQDFTEQLNHPVFSAGKFTNSGVNTPTTRTADGKPQYLRSGYIKISGVVVVTVDDPTLKVAVYGYRLPGVDYALGTHTGDISKTDGIYIYPYSPILCVPYAREAYIRVSLYKDTGFDAENDDYSAFGNSVTISVLPYNALNHYHTPDQYRAIETMKKVLSTFIPLENFRGTTESPVFVAGGTYAGIYYQSVQNRSRDALFNFSPETFFSMWNNPNSLIYQDDDKGKAYTGVVCSSFASWMTGQDINYTTWDMVKLIDFKTVNDISDIEIGDVLICQHLLDSGSSDHVMVVTNIFATADEITSVEISEAWSPLTRQIIYSKSRFMGLLDGTTRSGDIYHVGRMPNTKLRTLAPFTVNTDIISERGDNTYFDLSEDHIYVQSSQDSFDVKSPSGVTTTVNFSALTPKSGTEMRDMKSVLNSVGKWTLYGANGEESHLTIIDKGTATLENNVVTLSGYQGCTPSWFLVVGVYRAESSTVSGYDSHVTGHNAGRAVVYSKDDPRYALPITEDTFTVNSSGLNTTKNMAYYVRIFYDTGCGQAWQDTNLQYLSESGGGGGDDDQGDDDELPKDDN